eukprot:298205_1
MNPFREISELVLSLCVPQLVKQSVPLRLDVDFGEETEVNQDQNGAAGPDTKTGPRADVLDRSIKRFLDVFLESMDLRVRGCAIIGCVNPGFKVVAKNDFLAFLGVCTAASHHFENITHD